MNLTKQIRPRLIEKTMQKEETLESTCELFESIEKIYNGFNKELFPLAPTEGTCISPLIANNRIVDCLHLKILTLKQMLQRLPIALAQVKAYNTSENLLNETRQVI